MSVSLPGLQLNSAPVEQKPPVVHDLQPNTEWRFETTFGSEVEVKLLSGTAEIFGTEIVLNQPYIFNGKKGAIYTWHGCRIEVTGECQIEYVAEETPMVSYANTHFALENLRDSASKTSSQGPRILVLGPENAGKTSLVKLLASYATRAGRQPVVVNLDPKEGMLSIPGTLSAIAFDSIIDVEEGWGSSPTNGPSQIPVKLPLVFYYGLEDPESQAQIFKPVLSRLALSVMGRLQDDEEAKTAGCIVDTPGIISQGGKGSYDIVQHIVSEFQINVVIVLGSERLYSDMVRRFSRQPSSTHNAVSVIKLDRSGGCVDRDAGYLKNLRQAQVREYFFGDLRHPLSPHTQQLDFAQVTICRIPEDSTLFNSLRPGGETDDLLEKPSLERVQPSVLMLNCILAIMQADPGDSMDDIRDSSVVGFIYVAEVDEQKKKMRILAPLGGRMPYKAMIWGSWPDIGGDLLG